MVRQTLAAGLAAAAVLATAGSAHAATCDYTWGGMAGGDWMNAANWVGGTVPTANSNVCIPSGSAVLEQTGANAPSLGSLTISGSASLTIEIHQVLVSAATTIGPNASVTLDGTYNGANAGNASLGGGTVLNQGTITMQGSGYDATLYGTVTNQGTIDVPYGDVQFGQGDNGGTGSLTNQGTIDVAAPNPAYPNNPAEIGILGYPVTNAGGTITNDGTIDVTGANGTTGTFTQGGGSITGNAIGLGRGSALAFTGSGAGAFSVGNSIGAIPMSGNLAAGQSLTVGIGTGLEESGSFTNAGAITLNGDYPGGGGPASIIIDSGAMTNTGTVTATTNDGPTQLIGSVVNQGTMIATPGTELEETTGSFVNAPSGVLEPQISSSAVGSFGFDSGVTFTAGGTLLPSLQGGFVPTAGQSFKVVTGGALSGTFGAVGNGFGASYATAGEIDAVYGASPTPTPTPAPTRTRIGRVRSITGGRRAVAVRLTCSAGSSACARVTVRATVIEHLRGHRLVSVSAGRRPAPAHTRARAVTVAAGTLADVPAGGARTLTVRLNATGRHLLARFHALRVRVTVQEGGKVRATATVRVRSRA